MAKSNFQFKKRQKELARKKKKEEKRQAKLDKKKEPADVELASDFSDDEETSQT